MTAEVSAPARAARSRREGADELLDFVLCAQLDNKHGQPAELNTEFVGPLMNQVFDRELNGMTGELIDQLAEHVTGLKDDQGDYIFPAVGIIFEALDQLVWFALTAAPVELGQSIHVPNRLVPRGSGDAF